MRQFTAAVTSNRALAEGTWEMEFGWEGEEIPRPGEFFTLIASRSSDPLLRRPFAFSRFDPGASRASFIYLKRGKTTSMLSAFAPGAAIDVLGPLGRGFPLATGKGRPLLVSGGIGAGPVLFLADALAASGTPFDFVYGARKASLVPADRLPRDAIVMTDDGSLGKKGSAADALAPLLSPERVCPMAYACGPFPMLAAVARAAEEAGIPCSVSMEQHMACGVGACMGCAVRLRKGGYARACAEGPIFDSAVIAWEA
jgi:dihydroorotate dehydrogenase electron transfer subunit